MGGDVTLHSVCITNESLSGLQFVQHLHALRPILLLFLEAPQRMQKYSHDCQVVRVQRTCLILKHMHQFKLDISDAECNPACIFNFPAHKMTCKSKAQLHSHEQQALG